MPAQKKYNPKTIEKKWQDKWEKDGIYKMPELKKGDKKFYSLYSSPYPSATDLHVKTGTAQTPGGERTKPHAWITAYGNVNGRNIVVTVMIENAGYGFEVGGPRF